MFHILINALSVFHHHWPPGGGFGGFGGFGSPFGYGGIGLGVLPSTGLTYINGVPYEIVGGQLLQVAVGGVGIL
jgi:hypothetical protein